MFDTLALASICRAFLEKTEALPRTHSSQPQGHHADSIRKVDFQDKFDILLEMRISSVAKRLIWGKSQLKELWSL